MPIETYLTLLLFAFSTSISPGPNNMMLLASGVNYGFSRTVPHLLGIEFGFSSLILVVGLGLGVLLVRFPELYLVLKILGGGYLLWIAGRIAMTRKMGEAKSGEGTDSRPLRFHQAALFQFVNPKAWVMSVGATAAYVAPQAYIRDTFFVVSAFLAVGFLCASVWVSFGTVLRGWLSDPRRLKWFNIAMAMLLVASLWPMLK